MSGATAPRFLAPALALALLACGHRGNPRPPVYPAPPPARGLEVAQRGTSAILRFPRPSRTADAGGEDVVIDSLEVLVAAERYPLLEPPLLVAAIERRRDVLVEDAVAAAEAAALAAERLRAREAGETPREPTPAPGTGRPALSADEQVLRRVPPEILQQWRASGLPPDAVLATARQLLGVVDTLWARLGLPQAVIDTSRPPPLPDAGRIAVEAEPLLAELAYERPLTPQRFLERAAVIYRIPWENTERYLVGQQLQVPYTFGSLAPGPTRTRYFFAVRPRSDRGQAAAIETVVPLAPAAVPVAPEPLEATMTPEGVQLTWRPPAGDLLIRAIDPATVRYNVYRGVSGETMQPAPVNAAPLEEPTFTDARMEWGRTYDYAVAALRVPASAAASAAVRRESERSTVRAVEAIDRFPPEPPSELTVRAAGATVTLSWQSSPSADVVGYRVYRHAAPAPPLSGPQLGPGSLVPRAPGDPTGAEPGAGETRPPTGAAAAQQDPEAAEPQEEDEELPNGMVEAGWTLLRSEPTADTNYFEQLDDPAVRFVYAVEAVDGAGNVSRAISARAGSNRPASATPSSPGGTMAQETGRSTDAEEPVR